MSKLTKEMTSMSAITKRSVATHHLAPGLSRLVYAAATVAVIVVTLVSPVSAGAAPATPAWHFTASSQPTNFAPGATPGSAGPAYVLYATNVGSASTTGAITYTDTLPAGLTFNAPRSDPACTGDGQIVTCTRSSAVHPGDSFYLSIAVNVGLLPEGSTFANHATISGGGATTVSVTTITTISSAPPAFGFTAGSGGLGGSVTGDDGLPATQAGSHPDALIVDLGFPTERKSVNLLKGADGGVRDVHVALPRGLVVDPTATPVRCTEAQLEQSTVSQIEGYIGCPAASAVGTATVITSYAGVDVVTEPLYNMVPPPNEPASLAFNAFGANIFPHIFGGVRAGDYSLTASSNDIVARDGDPVLGIRVVLWGDPSSRVHDDVRGDACNPAYPDPASEHCVVARRPTPFLTLPTACASTLMLDASVDSWIDPGHFVPGSVPLTDANGDPTGVSGCSELDFRPQIDLDPTTTQAGSSSGLDVGLRLPQSSGIATLAEAHLKRAVVRLPKGMSLNPSAADGLVSCSEAQVGVTSESPVAFDAGDPACPDGSKVGTATIDTPLLDDPLQGVLYLASQDDNPFHTLLAGYLVAQGQGVTIKLAGRFDPDPVTGQITATFDDNPQLPFSDLKLHFKSGDHGVLITPPTCGAFSSHSSMTSWASPVPVELESPLTVDQGCDQASRFEPTFTAGTVSPAAAAHSSFVMDFARPAGQQTLKGVDVSLPPGLLAQVGSVPLCPEAQAVDGSCDGASRIGGVQVSAGAGANPLWVPQAGKTPTAVYLAGPYKGAPYSLSIVVPAQAGPFDLGTVVVRVAIFVDPIDAHVTAKSDPLPTILQGIPLQTREVRVTLDRPDFTLNPTSCAHQQIAATITSNQGAGANVSSPFQAAGCASLDLKPKLDIALTGKGQTTDDKHPGVDATLTQTPGQSNLKKVVVSLPLSLALDPDNAQALCEFTDGSKIDPTCPPGSIVGQATATTPILNGPLTGPVYFVKNIRIDAKSGRQIKTLPKLVIPLTGPNGLRLNLTGTSGVVDNHLVTTFDQIPDAPVSDFKLNITGGKHGILVVSGTDICKSTQIADRQVDGQNGKTADASFALATPACALKILSKKIGKSSVTVKVGGLGAGKVTVTGKGIKKTTKTIASSTVATITAKRTKGKPGKVTVSFDPTGPAKAHKTTK